jgi:threonine dehydrogenase-like Zn-dependent dehydrogenase
VLSPVTFQEKNMGRLTDKYTLITGGTSGIGLATAQAFIAEGARVAVTGRNPDTLAEAERILGDKAWVIPTDGRYHVAKSAGGNPRRPLATPGRGVSQRRRRDARAAGSLAGRGLGPPDGHQPEGAVLFNSGAAAAAE